MRVEQGIHAHWLGNCNGCGHHFDFPVDLRSHPPHPFLTLKIVKPKMTLVFCPYCVERIGAKAARTEGASP